MNTAASADPRIQNLRVTADEIIAHRVDGRVISVPLAWSWRLSEATPAHRANFRIIGTGQGLHWPNVDEELSVEGMLHVDPEQCGGRPCILSWQRDHLGRRATFTSSGPVGISNRH